MSNNSYQELDGLLSDILPFLGDMSMRVKSCHDIHGVLGYSPLLFFQKLHAVFDKCWDGSMGTTDGCNANALIAILDFVRDLLPLMNEYQTSIFLTPILPDIVKALGISSVLESTESLLKYVTKFDTMANKVHTEFQNVVLNTNDKSIIAAINNLSKEIPTLACIEERVANSSKLKSGGFSSHHRKGSNEISPPPSLAPSRQPSLGSIQTNVLTTSVVIPQLLMLSPQKSSVSKLDVSSLVISGKSHAITAKGTHDLVNNSTSLFYGKSPRHASSTSSSSSSFTPRFLDISFIPHSITEQWLLASSPDEVTLLLDEIIDIYSLLDSVQRRRIKEDVPKLLRQLHSNLTTESVTVITNALKLMELIFEDNYEDFLPELYLLYPRLKKYLGDHRSKVRSASYRMGCLIMSKYPFNITEPFLTECLDSISSNVEVILKMSVVALFHSIVNTGESYTRVSETGEPSRGTNRRRLESDPALKPDMSKSMAVSKMFHRALVLLPRVTSVSQSSALAAARHDPIINLAIDVIGVILAAVYPREIQEFNILEATSKEFFQQLTIADVSISDSLSTVKELFALEMIKHAKNVDYPTFFEDEVMMANIQYIISKLKSELSDERLSVKIAPFASLVMPEEVSSPKQKKSLSFHLPLDDEGDKLFSSSGKLISNREAAEQPSIFTDDLSEEHMPIIDSPWTGSIPFYSASTPGNNNRNIDPSKLSALKKSKRSATRAHSAHVSHSDSAAQGISSVLMDRLPNTSTGVRSLADVSQSTHFLEFQGLGASPPTSIKFNNYDHSNGENISRLMNNSFTVNHFNGNGMESEESTGSTEAPVGLLVPPTTVRRAAGAAGPGGNLRRRQRLPSAGGSNHLEDELQSPIEFSNVKKMAFTTSKILSPKRFEEAAGSRITFEDSEDDVLSILGRAKGSNALRSNDSNTSINRSLDLYDSPKVSHSKHHDTTRETNRTNQNHFDNISGLSVSGSGSAYKINTAHAITQDSRRHPEGLDNHLDEFTTSSSRSPRATGRGGGRRRLLDSNGGDNKEHGQYNSAADHDTGSSIKSRPSLGLIGNFELQDDSSDYMYKNIGSSEGVSHYADEIMSTSHRPKVPKKKAVKSLFISIDQDDDHLDDSVHQSQPQVSPKAETFEYLTADDIQPSENPKKEIQKVLIGLEKNDWPEIFHTLNSIRSIGLHHQSLLVSSGNLHAIVLGVMKQIDNLRSAVAKNAILTLGDLYQGLGKQMDGEVATTIPNLIKRFGDSNGFLIDSAEMSLHQMIENASPTKAMAGLLLGVDHRNGAVRGKVASLLSYLLFVKADEMRSSKELDVLKVKISKMLTDQSPETRAHARDILRLLLEKNLIPRSDMEQFVTSDLIAKALKDGNSNSGDSRIGVGLSSGVGGVSIIGASATVKGSRHHQPSPMKGRPEQLPARIKAISLDDNETDPILKPTANRIGVVKSSMVRDQAHTEPDTNEFLGSPPQGKGIFLKAAAAPSGTVTPSRAKANAAKRIMESVEELHNLPMLFAALSNGTWTEKKDAVNSLTEIIIKHSGILRDAGKLESCVDNLIEKLEDGSVKVILFTISCFERLNKLSSSSLLNSQSVIIPALMATVCSSNKQISAAASPLLNDVFEKFPTFSLAQQLSTMAVYEKERVRGLSFRLLGEGIGKYLGPGEDGLAPSGVVRKSIFPAITSTLGSPTTKPDVRMAAIDCLKSIHRHCSGQSSASHAIWTWTEDKKLQEEIRRIISS